MANVRSPPPPLAPPPSRETDTVFGVLLVLTGLFLLCFCGYQIVRVRRKTGPTTTSYSSDNRERAEYTDDTDDTGTRFRLRLNIPSVVLRPLNS